MAVCQANDGDEEALTDGGSEDGDRVGAAGVFLHRILRERLRERVRVGLRRYVPAQGKQTGLERRQRRTFN